MTRDPRELDQNPVVIDPANVDAVLKDRPTPASAPLTPSLGETHAEYTPPERHPNPRATPPQKDCSS